MIVADANLIAYYYLPGQHQQVAVKVLEKDPVWFVPSIMVSEFRNILLGYVRLKRLSQRDAVELAARVELFFYPKMKAVSAAQVMDMAYASGCSAYDGEYAALAHTLKARLVTSDKLLLKSFPNIAISPDDFIKHAAS